MIKSIRSFLSAKVESRGVPGDLIYAIGDIHGQADLLLKLMRRIEEDISKFTLIGAEVNRIKIIFLGDYVDRGLQSKSVIEFLISLAQSKTDYIFLKGNHEKVLLEFLDSPDVGQKWCRHGGQETLASYGIQAPKGDATNDDWRKVQECLRGAMASEHKAFLTDLVSYYISEPYLFVHAGIDPGKAFEDQTEQDFLWIRDRFLKSSRALPYIVVHGHTPQSKPSWDGRRIGIDTGAYITGHLTAVRLYNNEVGFLTT